MEQSVDALVRSVEGAVVISPSEDGVRLHDDAVESLVEADEDVSEILEIRQAELTDDERLLLYEKAMQFRQQESQNHALLCFLGCLKGLESSSKFSMLPQCMTFIAEIYAKADDYTKAVEFMQGAKLYYEMAIIDAGATMDKYRQESSATDSDEKREYQPLDADATEDSAIRANEYERLSNACLEQRKFQLALEYCGKATQLRQSAYGDQHAVTVKSLDLFTVIYAEMGKSQYSEAMEKYEVAVKEEKETSNNAKNSNETPSTSLAFAEAASHVEPTTTPSDSTSDSPSIATEKPYVEEESVSYTDERHESLSLLQLFLLFVMSLVSAIGLTVLWCYISQSDACPSYAYMNVRIKYWYYRYFRKWLLGAEEMFY